MSDVREVLQRWETPDDIIERFIGAGYDLHTLSHADQDDLKEIFLSNERNHLVKFKIARSQWLSEKSNKLENPQKVIQRGPMYEQRVIPEEPSASSKIQPECQAHHPVNEAAITASTKENNLTSGYLKQSLGKAGSNVPLSTPEGSKGSSHESGGNKRGGSLINASSDNKKSKSYDLEGLLKSCKRGRDVLASFQKNNFLEDGQQDLLVAVIIDEEQREDTMKRISGERFNMIAEEIVALFPSEVKETYMLKTTHPKGSNTYGGKLFRRYYNERKKYADLVGLKEKRQKRSSDSLSEEEETDDSEDNSASILLLETQSSPISELLPHWKRTAKERLSQLKTNSDKPVADYFKRFPGLTENDGYELLTSDFKYLYPNKTGDELILQWNHLSAFAINRIRTKDPDFLADSDYTANEKILQVLANFSKLFGRITVIKKSRSTPEYKPSRAQSQDAFLLNVKTIELMNERLENQREHLKALGLQQQPQLVVIGPIENPRQYLIVIDNFHYDVPSPLKAVEVLFKIYQALHARYPPEADHLWLFIQKGIYDISTKYDKAYTSVTSRLAEFKRFKEARSRDGENAQ